MYVSKKNVTVICNYNSSNLVDLHVEMEYESDWSEAYP